MHTQMHSHARFDRFLKLPTANKAKANQTGDIPAQIQFRAWFGDKEASKDWPQPSMVPAQEE